MCKLEMGREEPKERRGHRLSGAVEVFGRGDERAILGVRGIEEHGIEIDTGSVRLEVRDDEECGT